MCHRSQTPPALWRRNQRGTAIIMGLILLMVITLLSLGGVRGISIQEQMSTNLRDRNLAFQAAESALRAAEAALLAGTAVSGPAVLDPTDYQFWAACWREESAACPPLTELASFDADWGLFDAPGYRIERVRANTHGDKSSDTPRDSAPLSRVTARGVGGTADSVVILQATYAP